MAAVFFCFDNKKAGKTQVKSIDFSDTIINTNYSRPTFNYLIVDF